MKSQDRVIMESQVIGTTFTKTYSYVFGTQKHEGFDLTFAQQQDLQRKYLANFWKVVKVYPFLT